MSHHPVWNISHLPFEEHQWMSVAYIIHNTNTQHTYFCFYTIFVIGAVLNMFKKCHATYTVLTQLNQTSYPSLLYVYALGGNYLN